ncbi:MAG: dihydroneopterin aldolase [Bacteroidales bacterium]|jgi:dihydroneopterin aldolase|nr:dihydroneopterin aldolase [Bacteroidales bacterium]
MSKISIEDIRIFAEHGHFKEESKIGNWFSVSVFFEYNTKEAEVSDFLVDTIDYSKVVKIVREQMKIKSNLVENAAHKIKQAILGTFPMLIDLKVRLSKLNPSVGEIAAFSVEV